MFLVIYSNSRAPYGDTSQIPLIPPVSHGRSLDVPTAIVQCVHVCVYVCVHPFRYCLGLCREIIFLHKRNHIINITLPFTYFWHLFSSVWRPTSILLRAIVPFTNLLYACTHWNIAVGTSRECPWDAGGMSGIWLVSPYGALLFAYITKNMYYVCYKNYFKVIVNNMGRYLGSVVNWKSKL